MAYTPLSSSGDLVDLLSSYTCAEHQKGKVQAKVLKGLDRVERRVGVFLFTNQLDFDLVRRFDELVCLFWRRYTERGQTSRVAHGAISHRYPLERRLARAPPHWLESGQRAMATTL